MPQIIRHKRGSLESLYLATGSAVKGELLIATASSNISSTNGTSIVYATAVDGQVQAVNRVMRGTTAPAAFNPAPYNGLVNGVPYYASASNIIPTLYLLGEGSNEAINLVGNIQPFSSSVSSTLVSLQTQINNVDAGGQAASIGFLNAFTSSANSRLNNLEGATGSYETRGRNIVSSSANTTTIAISIQNGVISASAIGNVVSGSSQIDATQISNFKTALNTNTVISGSSQINYTQLAGINSGIISGVLDTTTIDFINNNGQLSANLIGGVVSGSSQINFNQLSNISANIISSALDTTQIDFIINGGQLSANLIGGIVSGSGQIDATQIANFKTALNTNTVLSGSSQVNFTQLAGISSGIISGVLDTSTIDFINNNGQLSANLIGGVVSQSIQVLGSSGILSSSATNFNAYTQSVNTFSSSINTTLTTLSGFTGSYATTGSNTFRGTQIISGSTYVTGDFIVLGSSSIQNISSSIVNIGTNLFTVNVNQPAVRFGGFAVIDSGSGGGSGSFLYDAVQDEFIFVHRGDGTNVTSSHFVLGPETYNNIGNETYLTQNRIPKGSGNEHIIDSQISDDGTTVSIPGSLTVTNNITGIIRSTNGVISGSSQVNFNQLANISANIVSASANTSTIAMSIQNGRISASAIGGIVSQSSQIIYGDISSIPSNIVSASANTSTIAISIQNGRISASAIGNVVSGSSQVNFNQLANISANIVSASSNTTSIITTITGGSISSYAAGNIVSGSSQIDATQISNFKTALNTNTVVSGSPQLTSSYDGRYELQGRNIVSGSSQINFNQLSNISANIISGVLDTSTIDFINNNGQLSANLIGGVVSGSTQVDATQIANFKTALNTNTVISGSSQVQFNQLAGISSGIISGVLDTTQIDFINNNGQLSANLIGGVVSGSSQVNFNQLSNISNNIVSASTNTNSIIISISNGTISAYAAGGIVSGALGNGILSSSTTNFSTFTQSVYSATASLNTFTQSFNNAITLNGSDVTTLGNLTVTNDLIVQGNTVTLNTTELVIEDKLIVLASGSTTNAQANGSGIYISGSAATITYASTPDAWTFNKPISSSMGVTSSFNIPTGGSSKRVVFRETNGNLDLVVAPVNDGDILQWNSSLSAFTMSNVIDGGTF